MQSEMQQQQMLIEQAKLEAELGLIQARSAAEIATARERHGRAEADIGLFEERLSEISQNRSMALKHKVDALKGLVEIITAYGNLETEEAQKDLDKMSTQQVVSEDREKLDAKITNDSNKYITAMMQSQQKPNPQVAGALL
jgi:hypothetical protein